ncbi:serine/threonine-protein kinase [Streptosporangium sp. NPDC051023]|uniref:serine/threonine-protein kinase n=1 Tax=Streptosporangium sp. NPDC051023 TaxID=3155410 RepID=UPI00344B688E
MPLVAPLLAGDPDSVAGYRVLGRLGSGGQGVVYLAKSPDGERVAIKVMIRPLTGEDPATLPAETELARRVRAFCTAQVLQTGVAGGRPYIVTEYVEGPNLAQVIKERGALRGSELGRLVIGTMTALAAIHRAGVVHRDFKPANVLLGRDGPRVIDFGIARLLDATGTGEVIGTPPYMAPEQFEAEGSGPPADMFAWACTIVCAATGSPPFGTEPVPVVIHRILHVQPDLDRLEGLDDEVRDLVIACLDKNPARRPTAAQALMRLLGEQVPPERMFGEGSERARPPHRPARSRGLWLRITTLMAGTGLIVGGLAALRYGGSDDRPPVSSHSPSPPAIQPTMAPASASETALTGSGVRLLENPADGIWVSSYQDPRREGSPAFVRDPRSGAFAYVGNLQTPVVAPGGRFVASLMASRLVAPDYDRIRVTDRASGAAYDIRTVDRPMITDNPNWSADGTEILLTVYDGIADDRPTVGFVVVNAIERTARITRLPVPGHRTYLWGPEPGTVMRRDSGETVQTYSRDGRPLRTFPGVGRLIDARHGKTPGNGIFLTFCPDRSGDRCVWNYPDGARRARIRLDKQVTVYGWLYSEHLLAVRRGKEVTEVVALDISGKTIRVLARGPSADLKKIVLWYTAK